MRRTQPWNGCGRCFHDCSRPAPCGDAGRSAERSRPLMHRLGVAMGCRPAATGHRETATRRKRLKRAADPEGGYDYPMVAKVSRKAEAVVAAAMELPDEERALVAEAIRSAVPRQPHVADRHAVIAARVADVHAGRVVTLSIADVEGSIREEFDF